MQSGTHGRSMRHALCFDSARHPKTALNDRGIERTVARPLSIIRRCDVDLTIWVPAMVVLGLVALALMFLFIIACDKV